MLCEFTVHVDGVCVCSEALSYERGLYSSLYFRELFNLDIPSSHLKAAARRPSRGQGDGSRTQSTVNTTQRFSTAGNTKTRSTFAAPQASCYFGDLLQ